MSKRKREPKPPADESSDDTAVKDDMVHVTSDLLAGGPEIFAGKRSPAEKAPEPPAELSEEPPAGESEAAEPVDTSTPLATPEPELEPETEEPEPEPEPAAEASPAAAPIAPAPAAEARATPTPSFVQAVPYQLARPSRGGSSTALGIVLVVVGLFALLVVLSGVDLTENGWPLFIIIPGVTLMVVGFLSVGAVATVPGGIVTMLGAVLAYSNATGDWPFWAYGWSLVTPGGVGLGIYLQALRDRDQHALSTGRTLIFISLVIFLIGFVLFESILGISGRDYFGPVGKAAFPVLMILVGVILLVRRFQQTRQT